MQTNGFDQKRPVALVILDGWGYAPRTDGNAIAVARTPYYDEICRRFPMTTLSASGPGVGLALNEPGGPEVGHLNLGTGRTARTDTARIADAIASGEFMQNDVLNDALRNARQNGKAVHLIGLVSDGGVHASAEDLFALVRMAKRHELQDVFVHCILDGVDVPERTADIYIEALEIKLADIGLGKVASLCGRYLAMDTNDNWERTARVFTMLVHGEGERAMDAVTAVRNSFLRGISDEFISPIVIEDRPDEPVGTIRSGDLVIFFNHRADGMRQLVRSLCVPEGVSSAKPAVETVCLTEYDPAFGLAVAFDPKPEQNTLIDVLSANQIRTLKITETARMAHLTTFFDGGADIQRQFEEHVILPGTTTMNVDHQPESQSFKIVDRVLRGLESSPDGLVVTNLPAASMMADTGDIDRTVAAIQYMDTCLGGICDHIERSGGIAVITSTYGRCEEMVHGETGEPSFAPTINPVPLHIVDHLAPGIKLREEGALADVAPTILGLMGLERPVEMTGRDLRLI